ncbi:protein obstructor-E-like [Bicyclus anynana]|uniref:Protein obstructor-E-like n=1 Tax=Bicyclus anynana TaxID=110368 RepID=A0ABM3M7M6_BICAN|nr:protein obstructor-E-like [Bicyclus anynana]
MMFLVIISIMLLAGAQARIEPGEPLQDYRCSQANGYEAVSRQCDVFIECEDNIAVQQICPDGLHFNSKAAWPSYPCGYPTEVQCGASDAVQPAQRSEECPHLYGVFRSSNNCESYTWCFDGIARLMYCPAGLVFNAEKSLCDFPSNVPDCSHTKALESFTCPAGLIGNEDEGYRIPTFRYGRSCSYFVACPDQFPRLLSCDPGSHFDDQSGSCVPEQYVTNCDRN